MSPGNKQVETPLLIKKPSKLKQQQQQQASLFENERILLNQKCDSLIRRNIELEQDVKNGKQAYQALEQKLEMKKDELELLKGFLNVIRY